MPVLQSQRAIGGPLSKRKESKGKQEEKRRKKESRTGKEDDRRVGKKKLKEPTSQEEESEGEEMPKLLKEFAKKFHAEELLWKLLQKCSPSKPFWTKADELGTFSCPYRTQKNPCSSAFRSIKALRAHLLGSLDFECGPLLPLWPSKEKSLFP